MGCRDLVVCSKCFCVGVHANERAREGLAVLMNEMWYCGLVVFGSVSSRIL